MNDVNVTIQLPREDAAEVLRRQIADGASNLRKNGLSEPDVTLWRLGQIRSAVDQYVSLFDQEEEDGTDI